MQIKNLELFSLVLIKLYIFKYIIYIIFLNYNQKNSWN